MEYSVVLPLQEKENNKTKPHLLELVVLELASTQVDLKIVQIVADEGRQQYTEQQDDRYDEADEHAFGFVTP